jgi:lysylphosphatidylglycerol synthetase-like protein (DUF2156 family)
MGMGVGTFIVAFLLVVVAFVFCLSSPCEFDRQLMWRVVIMFVFCGVFLALLLAPRDSMYKSADALTQVIFYLVLGTNSRFNFLAKIYDNSIGPRIGISVLISFFSVVAAGILFKHSKEHIEVSCVSIFHPSRNYPQTFFS